MERSDEARRMDSLQQALGSAERSNIQRADKITELERIIVEAKKCVKITQEKNDNLKTLLDETINKHNKRMTAAKEQIAILGKEIDQLHSHNRKALEQIWNKLKLVKLHF